MQKRMMCSKKALVGTGGFDLGFACVFDRGLDRGGGLNPGRLRLGGLDQGSLDWGGLTRGSDRWVLLGIYCFDLIVQLVAGKH